MSAPFSPEPIPTWARVAVYLFGAIVGASALAASAFDLYGLAVALGFVLGTAVAVPIGLDAGAVVCGVRWITAAPDSPERARWRNATLGLVAGSAVLNGLSVLASDHWITAALRATPVEGNIDAGLGDVGLLAGPIAVIIAVVIAAAFPLVAAWMVHAILEVRDAAARHRAPKSARRRWVRLVLGAVVAWLRARAAAARAQRELVDAQRALLLSPPEQEDEQESQDTGRNQREETDRNEPDPNPHPPALTGHKMNDAAAWYRWAREGNRWFLEHRRKPLPVDANRHIRSEGYVKGQHIDDWERELGQDPEKYPPPPASHVSAVS